MCSAIRPHGRGWTGATVIRGVLTGRQQRSGVPGGWDPTTSQRAGPSFIDTLAALHALDPDEIGLGSLGKRDSYVGRQLHRWYASWNTSKNRELPDVDRLHDWLVERLPLQEKVSVVHGDYGADQFFANFAEALSPGAAKQDGKK